MTLHEPVLFIFNMDALLYHFGVGMAIGWEGKYHKDIQGKLFPKICVTHCDTTKGPT